MKSFWGKVNMGDGQDDCWLWLGAVDNGYGRFYNRQDGKTWRAHRLAYTLVKGVVPDGLTLDHLCDNKACVNPDHLEPVDYRTNTFRAKNAPATINLNKTHCAAGHEYNEQNTYIAPNGWRRCRPCMAAWRKDYRGRKRKQC